MFETIRRQFLVEVTGDGNPGRHHVTSLAEVNQLLDHWVHKACHQQVHSETGQDSRQRWEAAAPAGLQAVGRLREALAWTVPATEPPQNPHRTRTLISPVARVPETILVGNGHTPAPLRRNGSPDSPDDSGGRPGEVVVKMFRVGTMRLLSCRSGRR